MTKQKPDLSQLCKFIQNETLIKWYFITLSYTLKSLIKKKDFFIIIHIKDVMHKLIAFKKADFSLVFYFTFI